MAHIPSPPPKRDARPVHTVLRSGTIVHRIYDPDSHGATATRFRFTGPFARFDHHTKHSRTRAILYAGADVKCCLVEFYGDAGFGVTRNRRHCEIRLSRDVLLLDLRGDGALRAGTITAVSSGPHAIAQDWSRYFYGNPLRYRYVDGLAYRNAHNEGLAYALYERAADAVRHITRDNRLDDRRRRAEYVRAALEANVALGFTSAASRPTSR